MSECPYWDGLECTQTVIEDLEQIKTLLERYNKGEALLAEAWDYINLRLAVYREG